MALHLVEFLTDEEGRHALGRRGRERAVQDFKVPSICTRHLEAIAQLEGESR